MISIISTRKFLFLFAAGLLILLAGQSRPATASFPNAEPLTVWHAWHGSDESVLAQVAGEYALSDVDLLAFDTEVELFDALSIAAAQGALPDLFLGPDVWRDDLLAMEAINGYCLPGECPACEGPNPPFWCRTAQGDFSESHNSDFTVAGLCTPEQCPCFGDDPPQWCGAAGLSYGAAPDIFQASLAYPVAGEAYPVGTPLYWDLTAVAFNTDWFVENDVPRPQSLNEILNMNSAFPELVYIHPSLAQDPTPTPMRWFIDDILADDPSPQPSVAGIVVFPASQYQAIYGEVSTLLQMPLTDYQPVPQVQAIYVSAQTQQKMLALDFTATMADPAIQLNLYQDAKHLPVDATAWSSVADQQLVLLGQESWVSFGGINDLLADIDPRDFIEWPEINLDFGDDPCSEAAEELHAQLTDYVGVTRLEILRAGGEVAVFRAICRSHLHQLEEDLGLGNDACSNQAREVFAQQLAALRGQPGAVDASRTAAAAALAACRGG